MAQSRRLALLGMMIALSPAALPAFAHASVTGLTQSHRVWREPTSLARPGRAGRKAPIGTTFSFVLSQPAAVNFKFIQIARGRRLRNGRCGRLTRRDSRRQRCSKQIVRSTLTFTGHPGLNTVIFGGWLSASRRLRAGRYELRVTTTADGRRAGKRALRFRIVK